MNAKRPGFLTGYPTHIPQKFGSLPKGIQKPKLRFRFLGDKDDYEPPPAPPPPGAPPIKILHAYNKSTGDYYMQNPACPEGDRTWKCNDKLVDPSLVQGCTNITECCDFILGPPFCLVDPESCDHPDTPTECDDDPDYVSFPDGNWKSCEEVKSAFKIHGIPEKFALNICAEMGLKETVLSTNKQASPGTAGPNSPSTPSSPQRPPLSLPFSGSCPKTHYKVTDAGGPFCSPCPPGQLYYNNACRPKPPVCPCNLPRSGDPDFGTCPKPPAGCGPAPASQGCNVPGYGPRPLVCKCGKWQCPTAKDLLVEKLRREGKPIPPGLAGNQLGMGFNLSNRAYLGLFGILLAIGMWFYFNRSSK